MRSARRLLGGTALLGGGMIIGAMADRLVGSTDADPEARRGGAGNGAKSNSSSSSSPSSSSSDPQRRRRRRRDMTAAELHVGPETAIRGPGWACSTIQGRRDHMEDQFAAHPILCVPTMEGTALDTSGGVEACKERHPVGLFAVFDGHSGGRASAYASANLPLFFAARAAALVSGYPLPSDGNGDGDGDFNADGGAISVSAAAGSSEPPTAPRVPLPAPYPCGADPSAWIPDTLFSAVVETDDTFLPFARVRKWVDGSTLCAAVFSRGRVTVANLGDSRAVIARAGGGAEPLSEDHKPSTPREKERLEARGAWELRDRICGRLNLTRGIGDRMYKNPYHRDRWWVIPEPDVVTAGIAEGDGPLIIATDGLWDALSNEEAAEIARRHGGDLAAAAACLVNTAVEKGSGDNITALVVSVEAWSTAKTSSSSSSSSQESPQR